MYKYKEGLRPAAPLLAAFSNRPGFANGLDRCRLNRRRNRIENDVFTNETNRIRVNAAIQHLQHKLCTFKKKFPARNKKLW